jgi:release factor glutamine methyltransferase
MDHNVLAFEPHAALFPDSSDVLIFYRQLAAFLDMQSTNCLLWAEINPRYAGETLELFHQYRKHQLHMDMSGKWRFIEVVK